MELWKVIVMKADLVHPFDKAVYLKERGIFDVGHGSVDWLWATTRSSITNNIALNLSGGEAEAWWDKARLMSGSPFSADLHCGPFLKP